jgi:hypothetical protein
MTKSPDKKQEEREFNEALKRLWQSPPQPKKKKQKKKQR